MYEQYYTEKIIGDRLIEMLPKLNVTQCIELSAGQGALLEAVLNRWPNTEITTCEVDPLNVEVLSKKFIGNHYNLDVLSIEFDKKLQSFYGYYDLIVSNPPYSWKLPTVYDQKLIKYFNIKHLLNHKRLRTEVLFILQNLKLLRDDGFAAFILPDLIIRSKLMKEFRSVILNLCSVFSIAEMHTGVFKGTEAKTYILIVKKSKQNSGFLYTDLNGKQKKLQSIDFVNGLRNTDKKNNNLQALYQIKRGNLTGKACKNLGLYYYHTTGFSNLNTEVEFDKLNSIVNKPILAKQNDILISRVGTRVLGNINILHSEKCIVSDCVFILRFTDPKLNDCFVRYWIDEIDTIRENARGTCAKYITKYDLSIKVNDFLKKHINKHIIKTKHNDKLLYDAILLSTKKATESSLNVAL